MSRLGQKDFEKSSKGFIGYVEKALYGYIKYVSAQSQSLTRYVLESLDALALKP
jgi:hypothetical protein